MQPYLHEHVTCVHAPATWLSRGDGQLRDGVDGLYVADRRILSVLRVTVDGAEPVPASGALRSATEARFLGILRGLGDDGPDPTVWCERVRRVRPDGGDETIVLRNASRKPLSVEVAVDVAADLATISAVKDGRPGHGPKPPGQWTDGALRVDLTADQPPTVDGGSWSWRVELAPGTQWTVVLSVTASAPETPGFRPYPAATPAPWHERPLTVRADDRRLDRLVAASVADLDALRLTDPATPRDSYFAAGSPWYLTLFARDALWAASMALPLGPELAAGTLRALARHQGVRVDPKAEEAPGKIPHELRPVDAAVFLPPVYYGTVDATPLFVVLLEQAWRWGMPDAEVAALLPAARRALDWLAAHGDPDADGFVEYLPDGAGLVNQGWKDSADGVQHADGRLATPPVALAEVQGYAHRAALAGAALFDAFGQDGGDTWRAWAAELAQRFRTAFWVSDGDGPYPAIALEAGKQPVDGPSSNMGHLLGTGLLTPTEEALVASRLAGPSLSSGYGLRTLADSAAGFNPLSYHAGSVWPHDTAIAVLGLAGGGFGTEATTLLNGLLGAAAAFDYRLPELYGGQRAIPPLPPVPYPAACRPQAWASAVGPALVRALLGVDVDVPERRVRLRPLAPSPVGGYVVSGVRLGAAGTLRVRVDKAGRVLDADTEGALALDL